MGCLDIRHRSDQNPEAIATIQDVERNSSRISILEIHVLWRY
jgi:hypothetical protein